MMPTRYDARTDNVPGAPLLFAVIFVLICLGALGVPLASANVTVGACIALLLFGLPHGALDLEILKTQHRSGPGRMAAVLFLYVSLAAAMCLLWQVAPVTALAAFLVTAAIHFSDDWDDSGSAFFAQGISVALLTAPIFLHIGEVKSLFVALSGHGEAALLAEMMFLVAPVSLAVSAVALFSYWQFGRRDRALSGAAAFAGMMLLPPAVGFAAFFCLYHSPRHFRAALSNLSADQFRRRWHFVLPLTLAALGFAVWLFTGEARSEVSAQVVAASFMTLSILTVPHMAVPVIVARLFAPGVSLLFITTERRCMRRLLTKNLAPRTPGLREITTSGR